MIVSWIFDFKYSVLFGAIFNCLTVFCRYYDATVEHITDFGEVSVVFDAYQHKGQTTVKELKERKVRIEVFPSSNNNK